MLEAEIKRKQAEIDAEITMMKAEKMLKSGIRLPRWI